MALSHATPSQPLDVRPLAATLPMARTAALFKSRDLEVIRLVLREGKGLPPHSVSGEITIHCLEGALNIDADGGRTLLEAGQLLFLKAGETHALEAITDASALVTIVLKS